MPESCQALGQRACIIADTGALPAVRVVAIDQNLQPVGPGKICIGTRSGPSQPYTMAVKIKGFPG